MVGGVESLTSAEATVIASSRRDLCPVFSGQATPRLYWTPVYPACGTFILLPFGRLDQRKTPVYKRCDRNEKEKEKKN